MVSKKEYLKVFILRTIGNFLLLSALAGVVLTFAPAVGAEVRYRYDQITGRKYVLAPEDRGRPPAGEAGRTEDRPATNLLAVGPKEIPIEPLSTDFGIVIPKINANAKVLADVDAGNFRAYSQALKQGVAHAAGTVYPGQAGNSFLFAHSVGNFWEVNRWNAVFYLLRELEPGDEVDLFFQGQRYLYTVYDKKIVEADEVGYIFTQANFPMLTLQTCWPPGTTLKRLLVFARLQR